MVANSRGIIRNPHLEPASSSLPFIAPQPGPQERFLSLRWVDIIVYGGAAGGGKSFALLLDAAYNACISPVAGYGAVIFRRTSPQLTQPGGLWETSQKVYPLTTPSGRPRQTPYLGWRWPEYQTNVRFSHLQLEDDKLTWQGAQVPWIGFDELTHFTESQFFYLLSRNRSPIEGIRPIMRATTNPDPDSWVKRFLAPWVDSDWPDPAKSGEVRYFYRDADAIIWLRHPWDRPAHVAREEIRSVTFIESRLEDNPALMRSDPGYRGRLMALPLVEREILLGGPRAWNVRRDGNMFKRQWFGVVDAPPSRLALQVRRWDLAGTEPAKGRSDPDWTVGVKMGKGFDGRYYLLDVIFARETPGAIEALVRHTAEMDGKGVHVRLPQDPGQAGKAQLASFARLLDGWVVSGAPETGDKVTRAKPFSSQVEQGNVLLVRAPWNSQFLSQLVAFPNPQVHDDAVDAADGAYDYLAAQTPRDEVPYASVGFGGGGSPIQHMIDAALLAREEKERLDAEQRAYLGAAATAGVPLPSEEDSEGDAPPPPAPNERQPGETDEEFIARRQAETAERLASLLGFLRGTGRDA